MVVPWPVHGKRPLHPGTGLFGGIDCGRVENYWEADFCKQLNKNRPNGYYTLGRLPLTSSPGNRRHVLCRGLNYHPDGGQVFYPVERVPFVMLLALSTDDVRMEDFVAFYFDGSFGLQIKPGERTATDNTDDTTSRCSISSHIGIWHNAPYQAADRCFFDGKQYAVRACVFADTIQEFRSILKVPLHEDMMQEWKNQSDH